jgi:aminoglycoside phosphotransferase
MVHQASKIKEDNSRQEFLDWLWDYEFVKIGLPVPDCVIFLDVHPACSREYLDQPEKLCKLLAQGLQILKAIDTTGCPFFVEDKKPAVDPVSFVHGDYCLPNVLVRYGKVSGFVDLSAAGIGDPWLDYAWCIWSLGFNLKNTDYTQTMLREIGIEFDEEKYRRYTGE